MMNDIIKIMKLGICAAELFVGFTLGFYVTLNMDQLYYYSLHNKFYVPLE